MFLFCKQGCRRSSKRSLLIRIRKEKWRYRERARHLWASQLGVCSGDIWRRKVEAQVSRATVVVPDESCLHCEVNVLLAFVSELHQLGRHWASRSGVCSTDSWRWRRYRCLRDIYFFRQVRFWSIVVNYTHVLNVFLSTTSSSEDQTLFRKPIEGQ